MQIERDKTVLYRFLTRRFKNASIKLFGEGWTSIAFAVDGRVLRFPKRMDILKRYDREIQILNLLRPMTDTPIPAPKMVLDDLYPYVVHEIIPGRHWSLAEFEKMDKTTQDNLAADCAGFLYQIHCIDLGVAKPIVTQTKIAHTPSEPVPREKILGLMSDYLSPDQINQIYDQYLDTRPMLAQMTDYCVLHLDFSGTNSILDENGRLAGVFDFVNANIKDRAMEFRYFYRPACSTFLNRVLDAYERLTGIRIDINRIKAHCLCGTIDGMRNMSRARLGDIYDQAIASRIERMRIFL